MGVGLSGLDIVAGAPKNPYHKNYARPPDI